jgi:hypothetical protein
VTGGPTLVTSQTIPFSAPTTTVGALTYHTFTFGTPITITAGNTYLCASTLPTGDLWSLQTASTTFPSATLTFTGFVAGGVASATGTGLSFPNLTVSIPNVATNQTFWVNSLVSGPALQVAYSGGLVTAPAALSAPTSFSQSGIAFPTAPLSGLVSGQVLALNSDLKSASWKLPVNIIFPLYAPAGSATSPSYAFGTAPTQGLYYDSSVSCPAISSRFSYGMGLGFSGALAPWGCFLRRKTLTPLLVTPGAVALSLMNFNSTDYWGTNVIAANTILPGDIVRVHLDGTLSNTSAGTPQPIAFQMVGGGQVLSFFLSVSQNTVNLGTDTAAFRSDFDICFQGPTLTAMTCHTNGGMLYSSNQNVAARNGQWAFSSQTFGPPTNFNATFPITLDFFVTGTTGANVTTFSVTNFNMTLVTSY